MLVGPKPIFVAEFLTLSKPVWVDYSTYELGDKINFLKCLS
jgi:hypothetical protein